MLNKILNEACEYFSLKTALVFADKHYTYAELDSLTHQLATSLIEQDIKVGDRVAFLLPNCLEILLCYYACFKIGAIAVPLNIRFPAEILKYAINHSEARILISEPELFANIDKIRSSLPKVEQYYLTHPYTDFDGVINFNDLLNSKPSIDNMPTLSEESAAAIFYTSGTTGLPKGVVHTHSSLEQATNNQIKQINIFNHDSTLIMFPVCYLIGFGSQVLPFHARGATCILLAHSEPKLTLKTIQAYKPTKIYGFPKLYNDLVNASEAQQYNLRCLNFCFSAGEAIPMAVQQQFKDTFGIEITEGCGMTELQVYSMNLPYGHKKVGSIGQPIYGMQITLINDQGDQVSRSGEIGEMIVHGGSMTAGYWNNPELTAKTIRDGWLHTGDLAYRDADGFYWFVSRKSEIIKHQGKLVSPIEVEGVLYQHPLVREVGVIGIPDQDTGEIVQAYVVLKNSYKSIAGQELIDFTKTYLANYKVPQQIVFTNRLSYGATGKIDRKALRENAINKRQN
jgi:long-chain acyl-CoA synthetase